MEPIVAVLFDADGVLFDACDLHRISFDIALAEFGFPVISEEDHYQLFNGLPTKRKLEILTQRIGLPKELHEQIEARKQFYTMEEIPRTIQPLPNVLETLKGLRARGIDMAICSNARTESVELMAECCGYYRYFKYILGNESVENNKPAPDIYLKAVELLKTKVEKCVIVEDSEKGLESAILAAPKYIVKVKDPSEISMDCFEVEE